MFCLNRPSSETSVQTRSARRHIPEDDNLHSHRRENLKSYKQTSICYVLETFSFLRFAIIPNGLLQNSRDLVSRRRWIHTHTHTHTHIRTHAPIEGLCAVYCVFGACPTSLPFGNQNKHLANKNFLGGMDCIYQYNGRSPGAVGVVYS
jgi:hypothetical protein